MTPEEKEVWSACRSHTERLLLDECAELTLLVDAEGRIRGARGGGARELGRPAEELLGRSVSELEPQGEVPGVLVPFRREMLEQPGLYGEVALAGADGRPLAFSVRVQPFVGPAGEPMVLARLLDVSEHVRLSGELRRVLGELQRAYRNLQEKEHSLAEARRAASLSLFAAGLAHELNNPVSIAASNVRTLAEVAQELAEVWPVGKGRPEALEELSPIATDVEQALSRVARVVKHLGELEGRVSRHGFELVSLVRTTLKGRPEVKLDAPEKLWLESDAGALKSLMEKVVDNACRAAGPKGQVVVCLAQRGEELVLTVEDDGPGTTPEVRERAFDPFFSTRPPGEGLGLGLFLARRAASVLGGSVQLEPRAGKGTRVVCVVPMKLPDRDPSRVSYEALRTST